MVLGLAMYILIRRNPDEEVVATVFSVFPLFLCAGVGLLSQAMCQPLMASVHNGLLVLGGIVGIVSLRATKSNLGFVAFAACFLLVANIFISAGYALFEGIEQIWFKL